MLYWQEQINSIIIMSLFYYLQPSTLICSYQWLNYTLTLEDKEQTFAATEGPFSQVGHEMFEHDLISDYLKRRREYFMIIMVNSEIEQSIDTHVFSKCGQHCMPLQKFLSTQGHRHHFHNEMRILKSIR